MEKRHYSDFFRVNEKYSSVMTREAINQTEDKWIDFYPHEKFVEFFTTLLDMIGSGQKSVWLTGNLGTGKSHAALVTQKLFFDDEVRVKKWFERYNKVLASSPNLFDQLNARRNETLVIYDYNASGLNSNVDFLVRLEKGIRAEISARKMIAPASGNLDEIINRLRREGQNFFTMRDKIQSELSDLKPEIKNIEQLIALLQSEKAKSTPNNLLGEVQEVLHRDKIYLDIRVPEFRKWVSDILAVNKLKRIVYIFDEFASFVERNHSDLKTFEEVTEEPQKNKFFLVPVTHMHITSYIAEGSQDMLKANDRFHFCRLQMPTDTAFRIAATAIEAKNDDPKIIKEWAGEKNILWESVRPVVEDYLMKDDIKKDSFMGLLPIHPMAAFLLKTLAESAQSNQRSIFEYLKGSANGREFQDFIRIGGPAINGKQFLTVDYLWKYFIDRNDLGLNKEIIAIRNEFERIINNNFQNRDSDDPDIRVLKTTLLFCLLSRLHPSGHELLRPTIQNVELSFRGDGSIVNVIGILKDLERKHCFNILNDNIELFTSSVGGQDTEIRAEKLKGEFDELVSGFSKAAIETNLNRVFGSFSSGRFEVRVSDLTKVTLSKFPSDIRENYGKGRGTDNGSTCLWFVIAKNKSEQRQIPEKIKSILSQLRDHRILFFVFPNIAFCDNDADKWDEYVWEYAQWQSENNDNAKNRRKSALELIEKAWKDRIKHIDAEIRIYSFSDGQVVNNGTSWSLLKDYLKSYNRKQLKYCPDYLITQTSVLETKSLRSWAMSGINYAPDAPQHDAFIKGLKEQEINESSQWFTQNPEHPFAKIRALFDKKVHSLVDNGSTLSVKQIFRELGREPYGLKYNALSAFSLGFALRYLLEGNYRWTIGQRSDPLGKNDLAEMIENAIKGESKGMPEKLICRISDEEKAFIKKVPLIFGFENKASEDSVERTILNIQNRFERDFGHIPIWIFAEYVQSIKEPMAMQICDVIGKICRAGSMSAKNAVEERTNYVKEVGKILTEDESLVGLVAKYVRPENAKIAFWEYIDRVAISLKRIAEDAGDFSHDYCRVLLGKVRETAGFLWNKTDIKREIDTTIQEYEVIRLAKPIVGAESYITYDSVVDNLIIAIQQTNKLPKSLIISAEPALISFLDCIFDKSAVEEIKDTLRQNANVIREFFFDAKKVKMLAILYSRLGKANIEGIDLLSFLSGMNSYYNKNEVDFFAEIQKHIDEKAQQSAAHAIKAEWKRIAGTDSPEEWEKNTGLPARFVLNNTVEFRDIINAVGTPENFAPSKLSEILAIMKNLIPIGVAECQKNFILDTVPKKYLKFNISLAQLLAYLSSEFGSPRKWPHKPDISDFIHKEYKLAFAPQAIERIKRWSPDKLRETLIELAQNNAELGLQILEDE